MTGRTSINNQESPAEPVRRYPSGCWDDAADYLRDCFILQHNEDYLRFLVTQVWKLDRASSLVEFGCGAGKMGL